MTSPNTTIGGADAATSALIEASILAHGGLERWNQVRRVSATVQPGGLALVQRGQEAFGRRLTRVSIDTVEQKTIFDPFLDPGQFGQFEPDRTAVISHFGACCEELKDPRASFGAPGQPWTATQLAYFAGYAMWTYLTLPFSLLREGVRCEDAGTWTEDGETWRKVKVTFPDAFVTHSTEQALYFDDKALIRRHDYTVDIAAGGAAAQYLGDHKTFDGIVFPTRRRIYPRAPDQRPVKDMVLMSADLSDFVLSSEPL